MAVELLPSITATTAPQLRRYATLASSLSHHIHLDLMDGRFVPTKSARIKNLKLIRPEVHAMTLSSAFILDILEHIHPSRVYVPIELGDSLPPILAMLRSRRIPVGFAISPTTPVQVLSPWLKYSQHLLVLCVQPGRYGAPLWSGAVRRVRDIRRRHPRARITCDGAMNEQTLPKLIRAGAQRCIVGSAVMLAHDPERAWQALRRVARGVKT
jgi:pentose-5-phosphate-3-epimerase